LANFDGTGAGLNSAGFYKVNLCNGLNGTPDKRGRVPVGAIVGVGGGALDSAVNPIYAGNPNYALGDGGGANQVTLNTTQIPAHSHTTTTVVTDPGHAHYVGRSNETGGGGTIGISSNSPFDVLSDQGTPVVKTNISVNVTNANTGGGLAHANIQPVRACYYIMYIP
jgi:microcystin-dependent protein